MVTSDSTTEPDRQHPFNIMPGTNETKLLDVDLGSLFD
jgi:hypothetical protein